MIEAFELRKRFGDVVAVDGVSFAVAPGEVFGLLGPNGAGKTTTLVMLAGLLRPDAGQVRVEGRVLDPADARLRRALGWAPQLAAVYADLTASENLGFFGRLYGLTGDALRRRIGETLEIAGLVDRADRRAGELSGGEKRRLNLAVALIHEPRILVLDEATTGLDPHARRRVLETVRERARLGAAVVYASHIMDEVETLCGRVALLDRGRIVACGAIPDLLAREGRAIEVDVHGPAPELPEGIAKLARVEPSADGRSRILLPRDGDHSTTRLLAELLQSLQRSGAAVGNVRFREPSLEDLFVERTGRGLRE